MTQHPQTPGPGLARRFLSRPPLWRVGVLAAALVLVIAAAPGLMRENLFAGGGRVDGGPLLAPFPLEARDPSRWIDSAPLDLDSMRGKVWVLEFWSFGCVNCTRSIPYANHLVDRYRGRVGVLGVHSPELDWERDRDALLAAMREHEVRFPSFVDTDRVYFDRVQVEGWPQFLVIDRDGRIRGSWLGEVHEGTRRAEQMEALIEELLRDGDRASASARFAPTGPFRPGGVAQMERRAR